MIVLWKPKNDFFTATGYVTKPCAFFSMRHNFPLKSTLIKSWVSFEKIQEILFMMGTEIFQFGPGKAEKIRFEVM